MTSSGDLLGKLLRGRSLGAIAARGAGGSFLVSVVGLGVAFLVQVLLARLLGSQAFGTYTYVLTWVNVLCLPSSLLGFHNASIRFIPTYRAKSDWGRLRGFMRRSLQIPLAATATVTAGLAVTASLLPNSVDSSLRDALFVGGVLLAPSVVLQLYSARLRANKQIIAATAPSEIMRPLLLGAGVLFAIQLVGAAASDTVALTANVGATIATATLCVVISVRSRQRDEPRVPPVFASRYWLSVSLSLLLIAGFSEAVWRTDVLMLGALSGETDAGIYSAAARVAQLTLLGQMSFNGIGAPLMAQLHAEGRHRELQRLVTLGVRGAALYGAVLSLMLAVVGPWLLGLFGDDFRVGYVPLMTLLAGQLVNVFSGSVQYLMTMTGNQRTTLYLFVAAGLVNIALNAVLIPRMGMQGAAVATATSLALLNGLLAVIVRLRLGINPTVFSPLVR